MYFGWENPLAVHGFWGIQAPKIDGLTDIPRALPVAAVPYV